MELDYYFMSLAINLAKQSALEGEVPVGAVITFQNQVIAQGRNRREQQNNSLCHAEIEAIYSACNKLERWRLSGCSIYVTLEPCPMCAGAIINSRIERVVYGADDVKAGSCNSVINLFELPYNHKPKLTYGTLKDECSKVLSDFFKNLREKNNST